MNCRIALLLICLGSCSPLLAQNNDWPKVRKDCAEMVKPASSGQGTPVTPLWKRAMGCGTGFFTARPVHFTVKSVVPGGGFGPGLTFQEEFNRGRWQKRLESTGVGTFQAFWSVETRYRATHDKFGKHNSARERFAVDFYLNARRLPHMDFYGIGPNTTKASVAEFRERDVVGGADIFNPFSSWLGAGARIEGIWPDVSGPPIKIILLSQLPLMRLLRRV